MAESATVVPQPMEVHMSTTEVASASLREANMARLFLTRGLVAIAWAAIFAAASNSLMTDVTVGVGVLLVLYPLIDVVASVTDARSQHGSARRLLLIDAAVSAAAAVALGVAAAGSVAGVLAVFGVWAGVTGAAQLVVARRRRALLGHQWPMLVAGGASVIAGVAYVIAAAGGNPKLGWLVFYTATGGLEFVIQAWLLARRRRGLITASADPEHKLTSAGLTVDSLSLEPHTAG
jgi:uncharacterized membrane protein HdeD (DUF308 family)